jgi:RAT1-interacting protein
MITIDDPEHTYTITFEHPFQEIRMRSSGRNNIFLTKRYMEGQTSDHIGGPRVGE